MYKLYENVKNVNGSLGKVFKECKKGKLGHNIYLKSEKGFFFTDFVGCGGFSERNTHMEGGTTEINQFLTFPLINKMLFLKEPSIKEKKAAEIY